MGSCSWGGEAEEPCLPWLANRIGKRAVPAEHYGLQIPVSLL